MPALPSSLYIDTSSEKIMASGVGEKTPTTAGKQMSSRLREKLKRCGRYHCSPASAKHLQVVESPLIGRGDNSVAPSPVPKTTARTRRTEGKSENQPRGGKRLFAVCSSGGSVVNTEHDVERTVSSCPKRSRLQGCEEHKQLWADRGEARSTEELSSSEGCECVSSTYTCSERKHKCASDNGSVETVTCRAVKRIADQNQLETQLPDENASELQMLKCLHASLQESLEEKQETLRKLRMVKMYRTKNNLDHLGSLISKWRQVSQHALQDLHNKLPEPKPSLTELVNHLQIDHQLVTFNPDEESFD